jgi:hypothetical protein
VRLGTANLARAEQKSRDLAAAALLWEVANVRWARDKCRRLVGDKKAVWRWISAADKRQPQSCAAA